MKETTTINKWSFTEKKFEKEYVTEEKRITTYKNNMSEVIECAACGKPLEFGDSYTSVKLFDYAGFGYAVCDCCHEKELVERLSAERKEKYED